MRVSNEEKILAVLEQIQSRQSKTEAILEQIQQEQADMRQEQADMRQEQADMRQDIRKLNQNVAVVETKVMQKLNLISEGLVGWNERNQHIDRLEAEQEEHGHRLWAIEQVLRERA